MLLYLENPCTMFVKNFYSIHVIGDSNAVSNELEE